MGLKEYVENKKIQKDAPKYNCGRIYVLYNSNGIVAPFVFNSDGNKIKDIASERIVEIEGFGCEYDKVALQKLYGIDDFSDYHYERLLYAVIEFTNGLNIPGKAFRDVRRHLFVRDDMFRMDALERGPLCDTPASYYELQPLLTKMDKKIKKAYLEFNEETESKREIDKNFEF